MWDVEKSVQQGWMGEVKLSCVYKDNIKDLSLLIIPLRFVPAFAQRHGKNQGKYI